ncbi:hypothetical protein [Candidatus Pelagibacter sp. HIMB1517]|uniref:hypothetical protein n=1 Tax=Candidatus Pelagibacter sp. HIMB1517 TaxID=3413341 RepID=UPI003F85F950
MPLKNCKNCNTKFYSTPKLRIYCSKGCSDRARKDQVNIYHRKYHKRPEVKEKYSKYFKEYNKRPEVKKRRSKYFKSDTVKEKMKKSLKEWNSKPATQKLIESYFAKQKYKDLDEKIKKVKKVIKTEGLITNGRLRQIFHTGESRSSYNKKYFATEKGKKKRVENMTSFYKNNLEARLALRMRHRIAEFMKIKKMTKKNKTFHMVGCTPQELKSHLESQFKDGMTWDNWTVHGWHIDHIIPLDSAKNEEDLKKLCHYSNLQPMWAKENILKSNKV